MSTAIQREALTAEEAGLRRWHEGRMRSSRADFLESLTFIRDRRLYRDTHDSFEAYCADVWSIGRSRAYQLAAAGEVVANLKCLGSVLPDSECQARPLAELDDPEDQREAWGRAVEAAPDGKPTGKHVREAVETLRLERKPRQAEPEPEPAQGHVPEPERPEDMDAHEEVVGGEAPDPGPSAVPEDELSDPDWLATLPARAALSGQCRAWFDGEALLYRRFRAILAEFTEAVRPVVARVKREYSHIGALQVRIVRFQTTRHPADWTACPDCKDADGLSCGQVPLVGRCPKCQGEGYRL